MHTMQKTILQTSQSMTSVSRTRLIHISYANDEYMYLL